MPGLYCSRLCTYNHPEKSYLRCAVALVSLVIMSVTLFDKGWFYIRGGRCKDEDELIHYLGAPYFYGFSFVVEEKGRAVYHYAGGDTYSAALLDCVSNDSINMFRATMSFVFIIISLDGLILFMDVFVPTNSVLYIMRRIDVMAILSCLFSIVTIGIFYGLSELLHRDQMIHRLSKGSKVVVEFSTSFYLITAAASLLIFHVGLTYFCDEKPFLRPSSENIMETLFSRWREARRSRHCVRLAPDQSESSNVLVADSLCAASNSLSTSPTTDTDALPAIPAYDDSHPPSYTP